MIMANSTAVAPDLSALNRRKRLGLDLGISPEPVGAFSIKPWGAPLAASEEGWGKLSSANPKPRGLTGHPMQGAMIRTLACRRADRSERRSRRQSPSSMTCAG
jgi:hypothetical protein